MGYVSQAIRWCLTALLRAYRYFISPMLGQHCRFYPSCSEYAQDALAAYSLPRALWMILCRLLRCHPWHPGGYDPVKKCTTSNTLDPFKTYPHPNPLPSQNSSGRGDIK